MNKKIFFVAFSLLSPIYSWATGSPCPAEDPCTPVSSDRIAQFQWDTLVTLKSLSVDQSISIHIEKSKLNGIVKVIGSADWKRDAKQIVKYEFPLREKVEITPKGTVSIFRIVESSVTVPRRIKVLQLAEGSLATPDKPKKITTSKRNLLDLQLEVPLPTTLGTKFNLPHSVPTCFKGLVPNSFPEQKDSFLFSANDKDDKTYDLDFTPTEQQVREALASPLSCLSLPQPRLIRAWLNLKSTLLYVQSDDETQYVFHRKGLDAKEADPKTEFSNNLEIECNALSGHMDFLRRKMRPSVFRASYAEIDNLVNELLELVQNGNTELRDPVKHRFEAIYFLSKEVAKDDFEKDMQVANFLNTPKTFLEHLDHINNTFFKFDSRKPSTQILSLVATHLRASAQSIVDRLKTKEGGASPILRESVATLDQLSDKADDLEVLKPVGGADTQALDLVDAILEISETSSYKSLSANLIGLSVDTQLEQIYKAIRFYKEVRE